MAKPVSNHRLDALLVAAGYDRAHAAFARQVNALGRNRLRLELRYNSASVYWWLRGRNPDPSVAPLMTETLGRRLKRTVALHELGFFTSDEEVGSSYQSNLGEAVDTAIGLWRQVSVRQNLSCDAYTEPETWVNAGWRWFFDPRDEDVARSAGTRVTAAEVGVLRAFQHRFLELDRQHGGGYARRFISEFLGRDVAPLLHGSYTDQVGRNLFCVSAELTAQLAFMAYDGGAMGLAQRAFVQALRLAKAADDRTFGAHVLANMSTQAVFMDRISEAGQLISAAIEAAGVAPSNVMARLHTTEACARAVAGDLPATYRALASAEAALGKQDQEGPSWAGYFTAAHFAGTAVRCFHDLGRHKEALAYAEPAMAVPTGGTRTKALHTALVATVHAEQGDVERACELGEAAVGLAQQVRSKRVEQRINSLVGVLARQPPLCQGRVGHAVEREI